MDASIPSKHSRSSMPEPAEEESQDGKAPNSPEQQPPKQRKVNCLEPKQRVKRSGTRISCLSPEVLIHIFRLLPVQDLARVARVCTAWKDIVYHNYLWSDVTIKLDRFPGDVNGANLLLDSLWIRGIVKLKTSNSTVLRKMTSHIPDLRCVTMEFLDVPEVQLSSGMIQQMTNLTELHLSCADNVTDYTIKLIAQHLKKLTTLELAYCHSLTDRSLQHIAMGLPELKRLDLPNCRGIGDMGLIYLSGFELHPPAEKLPQLQYLNLDDCQDCSDLGIRHLSHGQPNIQRLILSEIFLTDAGFQWLATFRQLRHLDISSTSVEGSGLVELANADSPITYLRMQFCGSLTSKALEHVARLKQLHELSFDLGDDVGLAHLADGQSPVAIVLCRGGITNVGLGHLARLPNLRSLHLPSCKITDTGLKEFVTNVRGPVSELRFCSVTEAFLNPRLSHCWGLGPGTLSCVALGLPALATLWLSSSHVNKEGMEAAARHLPWLHSLYVDKVNIIEKVRRQYNGHFFQSLVD